MFLFQYLFTAILNTDSLFNSCIVTLSNIVSALHLLAVVTPVANTGALSTTAQ